MKIAFKITKIVNIIALLFLILGPYGIAITGLLQVISAVLFVIIFPKNKLIYIYFSLVMFFFLIWDTNFGWDFFIPIFLIFFLTYTIYTQKLKNENELNINQ